MLQCGFGFSSKHLYSICIKSSEEVSCVVGPVEWSVRTPVLPEGAWKMEARAVTLEPMRVLRVEHRGPYNQIGKAFSLLGTILQKNGIDPAGAKWLGIFLSDPETIPQEELRSEACVTVSADVDPPSDDRIGLREIPAGLYATTRHTGSYAGLGRSWGEFCGEWIPTSGFRVRQGVCFEIYVKGGESGADESEWQTDLYEPIEPSV